MELVLDYTIDLSKYKLSPLEQQLADTDGQAFILENVVTNALLSLYPQGLKGPKQRSFTRIQRKLDDAKFEDTTITIEHAELDLLKEAFLSEDVAVLPIQNRLYSVFQDRIEKLVEQSKG